MIRYNWVCTACGATNPAGTDTCVACRSDAVVSASAIQKHTAAQDKDPCSIPPPDRHRLLFFVVHCLVTGAGALMILLAPREVGGGYFFLSLFVLIAGSNVVVALIKWFLATPNNRSRGS